MANRESALQKSILAALKACRVWCWRNNSGALPVESNGQRRFVHLSPTGSPDILGVLGNTGRLFGLEVKTSTGKQQESQVAWQKLAEAHGVNYAVVRSVAEALRIVKGWSGT